MRPQKKIQIETIHKIRLSDFMKHKPLKEFLTKEQKEGIIYTSFTMEFHINNIEYNQKFRFKSKPSNLIDGTVIWMFNSFDYPSYNLYLHNGVFVSKYILTNVIYGSQTLSTSTREKYAPNWDWNLNKFKNEINKKYFKKIYNGKITKRYIYLQRKDLIALNKAVKGLSLIRR